MRAILHIIEAEVVGAHRLRLRFDDGISKVVDALDLLDGPVFEPLRDVEYFSRMTLDPVCGTVVWPNGADFAPEALWELPDLASVQARGCGRGARAESTALPPNGLA